MSALVRPIARIQRHGVRRSSLALRILLWQTAFRMMKHVTPLRTLVRLACVGPKQTERSLDEEARVAELVWRVDRWSHPDRDTFCLDRSLVLYRLLGAMNARPTLVIGLLQNARARLAEEPGNIQGHAWVVVDGHAVGEFEGRLSSFRVVASFDHRGRLSAAEAASLETC